MRNSMVAFALMVVSTARLASAAGLQVDTQQARATGMGTAVVASDNDASSILYNPAGLAQGKGLELQLGDTLIAPAVRYIDPTTGHSTVNHFGIVPPPHLYAAYGITDNLTVGFGEFTLYGNVLDYPTDSSWAGRFLITHSELQTFDLNPTLAYRFLDGKLRVGAGFNAVRATVDLARQLGFVDSEGSVEIAGATWGAGWNAGVQYEPFPQFLMLGVSYRSTVKLNFDGNAHFSNIPPEFQSQAYDQSGSAAIELPQLLSLGLALRPTDELLIEFDADYTGWQTFHDISLVFADPANNQTELKRWTHSWTFHLGGEYALSDRWHLRLGALYDETPSPEDTLGPDIPDASRLNLSAGIGFKFCDHFSIDAAYMQVIFLQSTSTLADLPGDYRANANLVSLTLGYRP